MRVAVLGAGKVGGTLGRKWAAAGHRVTFGVRDLQDPRLAGLTAGGDVAVAGPADAIADAEVVVLAVPGPAVDDLLAAHGAALDGRIVVDATNHIGAAVLSAVAALTVRAPGAAVFRAFNTLGWENFAEPRFADVQADLFYCGSDEAGPRAAVERLIADVGLRPVRVGGLDQVDVLDGVLRLWFALAVGQGMGRHLAFKVLTPAP